ncbi:MAG: 2-dehydro-3-deoxyphosphooctonate aldolase [Chlamydiae bacterium]|nr:2-dehydro-3-deoxyphosphooctonate aldolase [Chlamydiota bacterium]
MEYLHVKDFKIGIGQPLTIISGPCVIEGEEATLQAAAVLREMFEGSGINLIFKSSYDKANRSSIDSFRGPGLQEGLRILQKVKDEFGLPVVTDVHSPEEATAAGEVCDVIQIPAFLCRQTDLLVAAAKTGKPVQVKKGQFMAPWDMKNVVDKIISQGNRQIMLMDRGTTFGYNNLVSDMRSIFIMLDLGFPVCYDATHSVQLPGGHGTSSGGQREFIIPLARAAIAAGANALFMESHKNPSEAMSDGTSMLSWEQLELALPKLRRLYERVQEDWF